MKLDAYICERMCSGNSSAYNSDRSYRCHSQAFLMQSAIVDVIAVT
jgi:hypothetical protein